jgi:hypothetical protein
MSIIPLDPEDEQINFTTVYDSFEGNVYAL